MNPAILILGVLGTVLLAMFIAEWVIEGLLGALKMIAFMLSLIIGIVGIVALWAWIATVLA